MHESQLYRLRGTLLGLANKELLQPATHLDERALCCSRKWPDPASGQSAAREALHPARVIRS